MVEEDIASKGASMTQQVYKPPDTHAISKKGRQIFEALSPELTVEHRGQFIAIDADSGDYFMGETGIEATRKAQATYPGKIFFLGRIGYRTAYTFKGRR
jgi:hypothetical protein